MLYRGKRVRERGRLPKGKFPKKGGRRLVSGLLALVLCLTLVPVIYADTVVTVTSWYAAGAFEENTLYWVDNNNEDGVRPGANTYQPSLWFRIDNGEWIELKGGEDSTLSGVGLKSFFFMLQLILEFQKDNYVKNKKMDKKKTQVSVGIWSHFFAQIFGY